MEEKLDSKNAQIASVTKAGGFRIYSEKELAKLIEDLKQKEKEEGDEDEAEELKEETAQ